MTTENLNQVETLKIPIETSVGILELRIDGKNSKRDRLYENIDSTSSTTHYQVVENSHYIYEFVSRNGKFYNFKQVVNYNAIDNNQLLSKLPGLNHKQMGYLDTGIYVGVLELDVVDVDDITLQTIGKVTLDIRSVKLSYERDYRLMLDDITSYYTDLLLLQSSPVNQYLEIDNEMNANSLYQRFCFVRSMVESELFQESIHRIMQQPVVKWKETTQAIPINSIKQLKGSKLRQFATSSDRIPLPNGRKILGMNSIPRNVYVDRKGDTIDNPENRFVKFALSSFMLFCADLREKSQAATRLKQEATETINLLEGWLNSTFFRSISEPKYLNFNSPVLQRKEGYREVLQGWLKFDMAARLSWAGGDDVFSAGKKNVATLYEYWLFFKLLELISDIFNIPACNKSELVKLDSNEICLNLKQGRMQMVEGKWKNSIRELNVAFYYNRSFNNPTKGRQSDDRRSEFIEVAGSWTLNMRPDYTLSLWPGDMTEAEAEKEDLITHIHFDAKYRLHEIVFENAQSEEDSTSLLNKTKEEEAIGIYKNADVLKMHAYKDAIRRTGGAYVLYPGDKTQQLVGFHEVVPGLGAFCVRPERWELDSLHLRMFLAEIKAHMLNRTSDREKMNLRAHQVYSGDAISNILIESIPESTKENRDLMADEAYVVVGSYKNESHYNWILSTFMYNVRLGSNKGAISISKSTVDARYLLLYNQRGGAKFVKIKRGGVKVLTRMDLINRGYPQKISNGEVDIMYERKNASNIYMVFDLYRNMNVEKELQRYDWNVDKLMRIYKGATDIITLADLIKQYSKH